MRQARVIGIVQARIASTRLPGKVLLDVCGKTLLEHHMERIARSHLVSEWVVAIPHSDLIGDLADLIDRKAWRSSVGENGKDADVLGRYLKTAREFRADVVVRTTSDEPLIDWGIIDGCVRLYQSGGLDYVSNNLERTFPHGTDVEVFSAKALRDAHEQSTDPFEREHVTEWIKRHQDRPYRLANLYYPIDTISPQLAAIMVAARLTVDYPEDLALVRAIFAAFPGKDYITIADVVGLLAEKSELMKINEHRALEHAQHLSGHFEPVSEAARQQERRAVAEAMRRLK